MKLAFAVPALSLMLLALLANPARCCINCDKRLWTKFLELMKRCLLITTEQECTSQLNSVLTYTKDFTMVYTDSMVQGYLKLMDLIYPFIFTLDYEPLDMVHAFLQMKLKAALCTDECYNQYPVQVIHCSNCSVNTVSCNWPIVCQDLKAEARKRDRREILGSDPQLAEKWRVAEMIMFPMIAILLIGLALKKEQGRGRGN